MSSRRLPALFLLLFLVLGGALGCGGGPSGTARSTIQGNVAEVEHARRPVGGSRLRAILLALVRPIAIARAQTGLEDIRVAIEGTPWETRTAPDGSFVLRSPHSGEATLLFEREDDAILGRLEVFVPEGATVTLRDVRCDRTGSDCRAEEISIEEDPDMAGLQAVDRELPGAAAPSDGQSASRPPVDPSSPGSSGSGVPPNPRVPAGPGGPESRPGRPEDRQGSGGSPGRGDAGRPGDAGIPAEPGRNAPRGAPGSPGGSGNPAPAASRLSGNAVDAENSRAPGSGRATGAGRPRSAP